MLIPYWEELEAQWHDEGFAPWCWLPPNNPHLRLFKVYWRLFTLQSPWEGNEFLNKAGLICVYDKERCLERCCRFNAAVWLYPLRLPRWDPAIMPWDLTHPRWRHIERWAPAYDDDPDPMIENGDR